MNKKAVSLILLIMLSAVAVIGVFWHPFWWLFIVVGALIALAIYDLSQTHHTILRNYPIFGHLRYAFEDIHTQIRQYFIEG
ncbi:MAG: FMN-binding glutamate synthase family protein, partial [Gammaproteobacteria bacterium]